MLKKRLLSLALTASMVLTSVGAFPLGASAEDNILATNAPNGNNTINFWLDESGKPYYNVIHNGQTLVEDSSLGMVLSTGSFTDNLKIVDVKTAENDTTWQPVTGQKSEIRDSYRETVVSLETQTEPPIQVDLEMRAYDTGVAFRYVFPNVTENFTVNSEESYFKIPTDATAYAHDGHSQSIPKEVKVTNFSSSNYYRPLTLVYGNGVAMTMVEASLHDFARLCYQTAGPATLKSKLWGGGKVNIKAGADENDAFPWRTFVIGDNIGELHLNNDIIVNLNDEPDFDTSWIDPGSAMRCVTLMNDAIIENIDMAAEMGIKYILLDTGWHGSENDSRMDARLPGYTDEEWPAACAAFGLPEGFTNYNPAEGVFTLFGFNKYGKIDEKGDMNVDVDIPMLCDYANSKGVGMMLYVNDKVLFNSKYTVDELFTVFERWGVKAIKPGFVANGTQAMEKRLEDMIKSAADHKLVMTIHDEYVLSGTERTYPNVLSVEGILGDEGLSDSSYIPGDLTHLYTRMIQGPADHTFCYGNGPRKSTKVYALASPILFYSPFECIFWYDKPDVLNDKTREEVQFWKDLPTKWDELVVLEAELKKYSTFARRNGDEWYIGSLAGEDRNLRVALDFIDPAVKYVADIYADSLDSRPNNNASKKVEVSHFIVDSTTTLERQLVYGGGYAVKLRPATEEEINTLPDYRFQQLDAKLKEIEALNESNYTASSVAALRLVAEDAAKLLGNPDATPEMIGNALNDLTSAMDALVDISGLRTLINEADKAVASDYTASTFAQYTAAANAQRAALSKANASKDEVAAAVLTIETAKAQLVSLAELKDAISRGESINEAIYTADSYEAMRAALDRANAVLRDDAATKQAVAQARDELLAAIRALVELQTAPDFIRYLSDMSYEPGSTAHGGIKIDRSYENPLAIINASGQTQQFSKGLGTHAPADITYNIEGRGYQKFESYVGINTLKNDSRSSVIFKVYVDGEEVFNSGVMGYKTPAKLVSVDITGAKKLRLVVDPNGANAADHADWCDAKLMTVKEIPFQSTYASDLDWDSASTAHANAIFKDHSYQKLSDGSYNPLAVKDAEGNTVIYDRGIGTHADANVIFNIDGMGFNKFESYVGVNAIKNAKASSVIFKVIVDGEERFNSGVMKVDDPAKFVSIDVTGAKEIRLVCDKNGSNDSDHSDWCDAKFLTVGSIPPLQVGDFSDDGTVGVTDLLMIKSVILQNTHLTDKQLYLADANNDGKVNIFDLVTIKLNILKGI
ncbi:NPCBM/NEW2 domain-containing protein [Candidatus Soleaferrea massiliensis]|uniref:NPCBM/NEW2 domain-containing protein n=1 Tax=Candidatus Soleaferrea massiliensis TaxID=1470354 RepID=UPI0018CFB540|nr:NPCBM/NEW2 domain-containing protein [Candidatus Soleaferrea massiliensis]